MFIYKALLIFLGFVFVGLGITGVFVPGLPATPFLLLSAALFLKSSRKLYQALLSNKLLGTYITEYYTNKGISLKTRIFSVCIMWIMIVFSCLIVQKFSFTVIMILLGIIGTIVMGIIIPKAKKTEKR